MSMIKRILALFRSDKTVYSHRNRSIEMVASEKGVDNDTLVREIKEIMRNEGSVEAIVSLRKRFHVTDAAAWNFVDKLSDDFDAE